MEHISSPQFVLFLCFSVCLLLFVVISRRSSRCTGPLNPTRQTELGHKQMKNCCFRCVKAKGRQRDRQKERQGQGKSGMADANYFVGLQKFIVQI